MQSGLAHSQSSSVHPAVVPDFTSPDPAIKKKKKRSREDAHIEATDLDVVKDKKKKRKRHDEQPSQNTPVDTPSHQNVATTNDTSTEERKKKKRDKGKAKDSANTATQPSKEPVTVPEPQISAEDIDANAQASTAALLSAIVAAAAGASPEMLNASPAGQIDPQYPPPPMLSNGHPPFMTLPMPYLPPLPPVPDSSSFSNMGLPFSDLSFGSNEDVLRALQDLDITKIANVLKTLGDAVAAANAQPIASFAPAPVFYPINPPPQPTPVGQVPAPSNAILGIPPKKPARAKPVDTSPAVPEQHGNPDHAELLANKWLSTSKLAELVRTEGSSVTFQSSFFY